MGIFNKITQKGKLLYRGSNGVVGRVIMEHVGVGPIEAICCTIAKSPHTIPMQYEARVEDMLMPRIAGIRLQQPSYCPPAGLNLYEKLDHIMTIPGYALNHLTTHEHVVWEMPLNRPNTSRLLESCSRNPRIAVLYAYGIDIDEFENKDNVCFVNGRPNGNAFVVVIDPPRPMSLAKAYSLSIAGSMFSESECARRIRRDKEVLLDQVLPSAKVVRLPRFERKKPKKTLNAAARSLKRVGVVV